MCPIYDYTCQECSYTDELMEKYENRDVLKDCPKCEYKDSLKRQITAPQVIVKPQHRGVTNFKSYYGTCPDTGKEYKGPGTKKGF